MAVGAIVAACAACGSSNDDVNPIDGGGGTDAGSDGGGGDVAPDTSGGGDSGGSDTRPGDSVATDAPPADGSDAKTDAPPTDTAPDTTPDAPTDGAPSCDIPPGGGTCNGVAFDCDEASDCSTTGDICCLSLGPTGITGATCRGSCKPGDPQLCRAATECGGTTPCTTFTCSGDVLNLCGATAPSGC